MNYLHTVAEHMGLGIVFASTGFYVRSMCDHVSHKIMVGGALLLVESAVAVALIG